MAKDGELHRSMCKMVGLGRESHSNGGMAGSSMPKTRLGRTQIKRTAEYSDGGAAMGPKLKDGRAIKMPRQAVPGTEIKGIKAARKGVVPAGLSAKAAHLKKGGCVGKPKHAGGGAVAKIRKGQYDY